VAEGWSHTLVSTAGGSIFNWGRHPRTSKQEFNLVPEAQQKVEISCLKTPGDPRQHCNAARGRTRR
jgi:hypothetical protein